MRTSSAEHLSRRRLTDGNRGWVLHATLGGYRIKLLDDRFDAPNCPNVVLPAHIIGDRGRRHKQSGTALSEGFEQCTVVEFAHDSGTHALRFEPLFECRANRHLFAGQEKRRVID